MSKLQTEFSNKGLMVLGANGYGEAQESVEKFVKDFGVNYQILLNASDVATDKYYVTAYPTTFWIDKSGKIIKRFTGFEEAEFDEMKKELAELLKE